MATVEFAASLRGRGLSDVDHQVIARLVRHRLTIERLRPWVTLASIGGLVLAVAAAFCTVRSPTVLRVLAVSLPSALWASSMAVDRAAREAFLHAARAEGLSDEGARALFDAAIGADHWIGVLESCGRSPSDEEVAGFVLAR
jgi:hypothetical protein